MFMVSPSGLRPSLVEYLGSYRIYLRVLVGQYDQVQIILWYPSWVISSLHLSASPRQVFGVAAASHPASSWLHGPLVRDTQTCLRESFFASAKAGKIVQLHKKESSQEGEAGTRSFREPELDGGMGEPCILL